MTRIYPSIDASVSNPTRRISFVCVRFSDDFQHNIIKSTCVNNSFNELIVVENRMNMSFATLGQAINEGIKFANNDLITVVHEDVLLLAGWQTRLEKSLSELEKTDPNWGVCGAAGWKHNAEMVGHWSDPHNYINTLKNKPFCEVSRLDEQILIFRRSSGIEFDPDLPSIHNIGRDVVRQASSKKLRSYAIDAPTVHKYADEKGNLIQSIEDSPKILGRNSLTYKADRQCSDEYYHGKWGLLKNEPNDESLERQPQLDTESPVILLGRGGSGTRLLSTIAQDAGVFIGNTVNASGDCMDMAPAIYRTVIRKYSCPDHKQKKLSITDIRQSSSMMRDLKSSKLKWGFKLPELLLILPEINLAFPNARYVHFKRRPIGTILRRSHMTARVDNHIGRIALKEAYKHFYGSTEQLPQDDSLSRMAITTMHQLAVTQEFQASIPPHLWMEIDYEETISNPYKQLQKFSEFCNSDIQNKSIISKVSVPRSRTKTDLYSDKSIQRVEELIQKHSISN